MAKVLDCNNKWKTFSTNSQNIFLHFFLKAPYRKIKKLTAFFAFQETEHKTSTNYEK